MVDFVRLLEEKGEVFVFFDSKMSGKKLFDEHILDIIGIKCEEEEAIG